MQDVPKENAKEAIAKLKKRGLRTVMLTGDNAGVAHAIAEQIGIEEVIANVLPEEKAHEIHKLKRMANWPLLEMGSMMLQPLV